MTKRKIKIVILFILVITILIGMWYFYHKLEYNKQSFATDIYEYVSPQAINVININREYNLDKLYAFDPSLRELTKVFDGNLSFPVIISEYTDNQRILITKVRREQVNRIIKYIGANIAPAFPPKEKKYKNAVIVYFTLSEDKFLVCTFYKGIFAVSYRLKPIQLFIDSDPENTFFTDEYNSGFITKIRNSTPACMFTKTKSHILALDYDVHNDSILLAGYILNNKIDTVSDTIRTDYSVFPYLMHLPDDICIDNIEVQENNKPIHIKIFLNKQSKKSISLIN